MSKALYEHFKEKKGASINISINDIFLCYRKQLLELLKENNIFEPYPEVIKDAIGKSEDFITENYTKALNNYKSKRSRYLDLSSMEASIS